MLFVVLAILLSLALSGVVVLYVAYPHRGEQVPGVPWLGDAMARAADAAPLIEDEERDLLRLR
ncbi:MULTISPECIES: hypothetical protein [unclassified Nocardioides]|uniref:hypothetical protein n=1 Tax=unclassified Nocardioides TaxID=2615069 RepID=UPI00070395B3|nr:MULTISPECIES: hypothetical protein [unclassified Nocardioides]KRC46175.1 hypothetical protein ASE19_20135 [Nocardioides sp. Root79]KRC69523.1 hypothetical protein ASE20_12995 [Nocardioides sp. Root240]